jgi:hypothetical protein
MLSWLVSFIVIACVFAVVIILAKWVIGLTGVVIPQPLLVVAGILLFLVLIVWLFTSGPIFSLGPLRR